MKISIITLFPEVFNPILNSSILKRARAKGKVTFELINLRNFGEGRHQIVDDRPYGGGAGMVLKADVLAKALASIEKNKKRYTIHDKQSLRSYDLKPHTILMSASGTPYKQQKAQQFSKLNHLVIICGHYEGVDQRFIENYVDEEISIGDYVLTGGEIPAMVIADSVVRLIPGVLEKPEATINESFTDNLLEGPQYTRPEEFEGIRVPDILLSGNHKKIEEWRKQKSLQKTNQTRPDLLK